MNVMLDLETMGNGPDAAIVAIGAVEFDPANRVLGRTFYCNIDLESAVENGGVMDASTVQWWLRQDEAARRGLFDGTRTIHDALTEFSAWMACIDSEDVQVWGNGATFDNVILTQAYKRAGLWRPWSYKGDRCYRTLKALHPEKTFTRTGTHHNALDDAISQAAHAITLLRS